MFRRFPVYNVEYKLIRFIYLNSFDSMRGDILQSDPEVIVRELNETSFLESGLILFILSISKFKMLIFGLFVTPILLTLSQLSYGEPCIWCSAGQIHMGFLLLSNIILFGISLYKPQFAVGFLLGSIFSWFYFFEYVWI